MSVLEGLLARLGAHLPIVFLCLFLLLMGIALLIYRRLSFPREPQEEMDGHGYENYCAELLQNRGFHHIEVTPGSGDYGADILAQRDGISYAFQCKYYDHPVGVHAVQEIYAGRDYYGCMVGVVLTNQTYTKAAREMADRLNILLWEEE